MRISIVGTGYVGLVTGAGLAEKGHEVTCIDVIQEKVDSINEGKSPIYEIGLDDILNHAIPDKLKATTDFHSAVKDSAVTFICVGTPSSDDGEIDLKCIREVSAQIGGVIREKDDYHVVVVKSTVVPGTTMNTVKPILEEESGKTTGVDFGVGVNPEFLREGMAVKDFLDPDRIVIGSTEQKTGDIIESIYHGFTSPILRVDVNTAEMIKYTSNALLATKISFINEIGNICKKIGIDVYDVAKGVGLDHRISPHFMNAGPGFGGSCFPKDVKALVYKAQEVNEEPILLNSVLKVNERQPLKVVEIVKKKLKKLDGKNIAVLGLAFKADTDDMRESPSIPIVKALVKGGARIKAYDPQAGENAREFFKDTIEYVKSAGDALKGADLALVLTEWREFENLKLDGMKKKVLVDTRHIVNMDRISGVDYEGICW